MMVNQVSRTIAYMKKKSQFVHKTNWQTQAFGKTIHQIQRGEFFFSFLKKESKFSYNKKKSQAFLLLRSER